jgi:signal transduction histidine kinase
VPRRHWATGLGLLAAALLAGYLLYTEFLVREMRRDAQVHSRIYLHVLQGLADPREGAAEQTLFELAEEVQHLGIPIVVADADGIPTLAANLPFRTFGVALADDPRIARYMRRLARDHPPIVEPGIGIIYFGDPPLVRRLRWVPWLQVVALTGILVAAWWMIRHNQRVERERIWASMARESAHQIATPLSSLSGWVEILRLPAEEQREITTLPALAAEMEADLERLEKVSRRFEWIGRPLQREEVDVQSLLLSLERYVRVRLPRLGRGVDVQLHVEPDLPPVRGNAVLLEWALENLVKNALDALAGSGGIIDVRAERERDGGVVVRVCDDGPGVDPSVRSRIFEAGVSTKRGGWGVGLSLARRIVEEVHGGTLRHEPAESGARFAVRLPAGDGEAA